MDDFVTEDNKKREDLKNLLFELSASFIEKNNLSVYYKRLENIYLNNNITNDSCKEYQFRHYYSDIYSTFYRIIKERDENSIINLICNIGLLKDSYLKYKENISSQNRIQRNIYKNLVKLFDHINLEYARYAENDLSLNALEKGRKEINELKNEYEEKKENIEKGQSMIEQELSNRDLVPKEFMTKADVQRVIDHSTITTMKSCLLQLGMVKFLRQQSQIV